MRPLFLLLTLSAFPQNFLITTAAGGARLPLPAQTTAANLRFVLPAAVTTDPAGNIYVADSYYDRVLRITPTGATTTYAGSETGFSGDNGPPTAARFNGIAGLALTPAGELLICDLRNARIRKVSRDGATTTTIAGTGSTAANGDTQPATAAAIGNPKGITVDAQGNIYFSDSLNHLVRKINPAGLITTLAGTPGRPGFSGDNGPANAALLNTPAGLTTDPQGNIYIADTNNHRIRRVDSANTIQTFAGTGVAGSQGANTTTTQLQLNSPSDVAINRAGELFLCDRLNGRILRVRNGTTVSTIAGGGASRTIPGSAIAFDLALPVSIAFDSSDQLLVFDDALRKLYRVAIPTDRITEAAGANPGLAERSVLFQPSSVAVDPDGAIYVSDIIDNTVRRFAPDGAVTTIAGTGALGLPAAGGPAARNIAIGRPRGMTFDRNRNLYFAATWGAYVYKVTPDGALSIFAGGPNLGFSGDNLAANTARLNIPFAVAADPKSDNIYIADSANHRIRRVDSRGFISTFAGTGEAGFSGDNGPATAARLNTPRGVAVDSNGNVYIADSLNHRVRRIDPSGRITTIAGTGTLGSAGAGGPATEAQLWTPAGLTFTADGTLYIANSGSSLVRALTADGTLQPVAGSPLGSGFSGDGGPAIEARLSGPTGLATAPNGAILIADQNNERVRKLEVLRLSTAGVRNRASQRAGAVAPNEIVSVQGIGLGPAENDPAATQVLFDGVPAQVLWAQDRLVIAAVPPSVAGDTTKLQVIYNNQPTPEIAVAVAPSAPGVFTVAEDGKGQIAARNEDDTENTEATPALPGYLVRFLATGLGAVTADDPAVPQLPIEVTVAGQPAELVSARVAPGQLPGFVEIIVRLPADLAPGNAAVVVKAGEAVSQPDATVAIGKVE